VFVLDMGEPVRIIDLARNMIELSGLTVRDETALDGDIEIRCIGLRPGEKLYEELLIGENSMHTAHERILQARESFMPPKRLFAMLNDLSAAVQAGDVLRSRQLLQEMVPEYQPSSEIVDFVARQRALRSA